MEYSFIREPLLVDSGVGVTVRPSTDRGQQMPCNPPATRRKSVLLFWDSGLIERVG